MATLAVAQSDSLFKGRSLTVNPKRKNIPGRGRGRHVDPMEQFMAMFMRGGGRGRGFGGGRGGPRGGRGGGGFIPRGGQPP